tara:strand:+ start:3874 stop:4380 length:507 start_codon:yes stop_codon:yes gene_type:complete
METIMSILMGGNPWDWKPSMLTFNGGPMVILVHAALWIIPAIIVLANRDDLETGQDDVAKQILTLYLIFSFATPGILVVYEILMLKGYPKLKAVGQGFIFGFGYLTLGLAAASTANLNDKDHVNIMVACLFLTSSALGMFTTFYATFMKAFDEDMQGFSMGNSLLGGK